ncbi:S-layer homology domain-containing protein, partial [Ureibacillus acetophenoni]
MAVILAKVLNLETTNVEDPGFIDVPKTHPYYVAIAALYKAGLVSGHTDRTFRPQEPLSRYHMALILSKAFKFSAKNPNSLPFTDVHPNYREFVAALYELGITLGISNTTFGGVENLSRGQFVQFLLKAEEARKKLENENTTPT